MSTRILLQKAATRSSCCHAPQPPPQLLPNRFYSSSLRPSQPFLPHSRGHTRPASLLTTPLALTGTTTSFRHSLHSVASPPMSKGSSSGMWPKLFLGSAITLATSVTVMNQLAKTPQMHQEPTSASGNVFMDLKDKDNKIGVQGKSNGELVLSMMVYKLCTLSLLVDMAPHLISLAEKLHLSAPVYWIVRKTFFAQFCGGESAEDCVGTMQKLKSAGIGSILDLSIEADLEEVDSDASPAQVREHANKSADSIASQIRTCIQTASTLSKSFAAIKVTALSSPALLQQVSDVLVKLENKFEQLDGDKDGKVTLEEFKQLIRVLPGALQQPQQVVESLFMEADKNKDGLIDWVDFAATVTLNKKETRPLFLAAKNEKGGLAKEDLEDYEKVMERLYNICDDANETHTRVMVDAEQSYFQPAIDSLALHLQDRYNHASVVNQETGPLIFNTYQMYLKDALGRLERDYTRAQRNDYVLAAKLVRGAYMVGERKRAQELGLSDPICDGIEATHRSYNAGVDFMLKQLSTKQLAITAAAGEEEDKVTLKTAPVVLFVASHNKDSVIRTCGRMQELEIQPESGLVMFGQLMGMCDQISYTLGQHGYGIFKYVPYGPIHHVMPYLIRRAQENASVMGAVSDERRLLWAELKSRYVTQKERAQISVQEVVEVVPSTIAGSAGPTVSAA